MNVSGGQGSDDYGLPPVDIEIPDDARELERDVLAYHREQRILRRQRFWRRLHEPLTRDGLVLPLLACCLALTLVAGTILTVFTGAQSTLDPAGPASSAGPQGPAAGQRGGPLPDTVVELDGAATAVRALPRPAVLALVPGGCRCESALALLNARVSAAGARLYVVGTGGASAAAYTREIGLPPTFAGQDSHQGLADAYHPTGLTALFVRADGAVVSIVRSPTPAAFDGGLRSMTAPAGSGPAAIGPAGAAAPRTSAPGAGGAGALLQTVGAGVLRA